MKNKNFKLTTLAISTLVLLGVAGGTYYRVDQLQQKREYFQNKFSKSQSMLPKSIVISKSAQATIFDSDIKYTISVIEDGKKSDNQLIINTHLHHGLSYFFSGVIEGTSIGKLEGPVTKDFTSLSNNNGNLFNSQIQILPDNTFISHTTFTDLTGKDGSQIKGMTSYMEASSNDNIKTDFKVASISGPTGPKGQSDASSPSPAMFNLKDFSMNYNGKPTELGNNHFGLTIGTINADMLKTQVNNISLNSDSVSKNGAVDLITALKIDKIKTFKWDNASVDFKYSILGLDESALKSIYSIGQHISPNADSVQKGITEVHEQFKKIFIRGFAVNVDKLSFKATSDKEGTDSFDLSFKSSIPAVKTFDDVSFDKNLLLSYSINSSGSLSSILEPQINTYLTNLGATPEQLVKVTDNKLKFSLDITKDKGQLNGVDFTTDENNLIHMFLATFDAGIHSAELEDSSLTSTDLPGANSNATPTDTTVSVQSDSNSKSSAIVPSTPSGTVTK